MQPKFSDKNATEISELCQKVKCLIVTTTDIETSTFREKFKPVGEDGIIRFFYKRVTLYIGKFGNYLAGHVQCTSMGGIAPGASASTVKAAIEFFQPKAVIMPGIAFGVNSKKQRIGNVIVSESIIPYDMARVSKDETVYRGNMPLSGSTLINRFRNGAADWTFPVKKDTHAEVHFGKVLSGESLIDNVAYRDALKKEFAGVIGGEMEGMGLFAAAHEHHVEWILVKGICDFADGNKGKMKAQRQALAARSSIALCEHVLSMKSVLDDLNIPSHADRNSESKVFNEKWKLSGNKHFEILTPIVAERIDEAHVHVKVNIKNILSRIGTCYVVIKFAENGDYDNPCYSTDSHLDEKAAEQFKIFDIYPGEYNTLEKVIQLPSLQEHIECKVEVWSPKRLDFTITSDDRIALFDRSAWHKVQQVVSA